MSTAILILGGTAEAAELATILARRSGLRVVTSLAGRTRSPRPLPGETRIGGFGGAAGLAAWLDEQEIAAVVDATHPFAARMGANAAEACTRLGVPLLRLERPAWSPPPGAVEVEDWTEARTALERMDARSVFLAVGRQDLEAFIGLKADHLLLRAVDDVAPPPDLGSVDFIVDRGPFSLDDEIRVLREHRIDALVCRNAGGEAAHAKLDAAAALGIPVVMRRRPPRPALPTATDVDGALLWISKTVAHHPPRPIHHQHVHAN